MMPGRIGTWQQRGGLSSDRMNEMRKAFVVGVLILAASGYIVSMVIQHVHTFEDQVRARQKAQMSAYK